MGWGRTLLLGDWGNRMDIADVERKVGGMRRQLRSKSRRDDAQEARLEALEAENEQLKLYVAGLIRVLVGKGTLTPGEVTAFVDGVEGPPELP